MEPTIILEQGERDWRNPRLIPEGRPNRGVYGVHRSASRFYWMATTTFPPASDQWEAEGFATDAAAATAGAVDAIRRHAPVGYVFVCRPWWAGEWFRERHAKVSRFRADWRERFPFWSDRVCLWVHYSGEEGSGYARIPIVAVTEKWVYIPREPQFRDAVAPGRIARRDCRALPRSALEREGRVIGGGWWESFSVDAPAPVPVIDPVVTNRARIAELRSIMQREHPDRGGDVERFRAAQREFAALRRAAR
jgi:hypothetical protein